jgi:hypothetical protein
VPTSAAFQLQPCSTWYTAKISAVTICAGQCPIAEIIRSNE